MITFKKITPSCSNVYLIDENVCLANSLNTINYNFSSLNNSLSSLQKYRSSWYSLFTTVVSNSAIWIKTATNIQSYSAIWLDTTNTVSTLSSTWTKPYTLIYPKMLDMNSWYALTTQQKNSTITSWMNTNFKIKNPRTYQTVDVILYLTQNQPFFFSFNRSFEESCTPNGGGASLGCSGCSRPNRGCNHHGGKAGYGPCTNAYNACSVRTTSGSASVSCVGTGAKRLNIGINRSAADRNVARTISIKVENVNGVWTIL
jgi:hypothetical protein